MVVVERLTPLETIKEQFSFSGPIVLKTIALLMLYLPLSVVGNLLSVLPLWADYRCKCYRIPLLCLSLAYSLTLALFRFMVSKKPSVE